MTIETPQTTTTPTGAASVLDDGLYAREALRGLANRLRKAGRSGVGCRVSAEEAGFLLSYNLPCTADDPGVMDGE